VKVNYALHFDVYNQWILLRSTAKLQNSNIRPHKVMHTAIAKRCDRSHDLAFSCMVNVA